MPTMQRSVVVLPAPFGADEADDFTGRDANERSSTATNDP